MNKFRKALPGATAYSLAGLVWGSLVASVIGTVASVVFGGWPRDGAPALLGNIFGIYAAALVLGLFLVLVLGIPLYAGLRALNRDSYATASIVGLVPAALVLLPFGWRSALLFLLFGLSVGLTTHFFAERARQYGDAL